MKRKLLTLSLTLVGSLLFVAAAQAVTISECATTDPSTGSQPFNGEFTLVAQNAIGFEQGPTVINGNVLVTSATGTANVGAHNTINGKLFAANIFLGTGAFVAECHGAVSGPGECGSTFPFDASPACLATFPPLGSITVDNCVNVAPGNVNKTFSGSGNTLAPGCYRSLRLNALATLELEAGEVYRFKDVRLLAGSHLRSDTASSKATVNVNGLFVTEPNVTITDLLVNSASSTGAVVALGNANTLTRTVFNAPFGNIHPRTGTALNGCSELIGKTLTIEPISAECDIVNVCKCDPGFTPETAAPRCIPIGE